MHTEHTKLVELDGSHGEGGGQILRSALALSLVTGRPLRIHDIRARRRKPGLLRQHLTAVRAATRVGLAEVEGDTLGSRELSFTPGALQHGELELAVGTAGSTTLVLQTVLPALLVSEGRSRLVLEGGTHNPLAPPFDFIERAFLPVLARMGARVTASLERHGFAPAGGGRIVVEVEGGALSPVELLSRGALLRRTASALVANLSAKIARRELSVIEAELGFAADELRIVEVESQGPGNVVLIELESEGGTEVVASFGEKGVSAEAVARRAVEDARAFLSVDAPVGEHLADQLLLPLALAGGGAFRTRPLSSHARTNIDVIERFLPETRFSVETDGDAVVVRCRGPRIAPVA